MANDDVQEALPRLARHRSAFESGMLTAIVRQAAALVAAAEGGT